MGFLLTRYVFMLVRQVRIRLVVWRIVWRSICVAFMEHTPQTKVDLICMIV